MKYQISDHLFEYVHGCVLISVIYFSMLTHLEVREQMLAASSSSDELSDSESKLSPVCSPSWPSNSSPELSISPSLSLKSESLTVIATSLVEDTDVLYNTMSHK